MDRTGGRSLRPLRRAGAGSAHARRPDRHLPLGRAAQPPRPPPRLAGLVTPALHLPPTGPTTLAGRPARWSHPPLDGPPVAAQRTTPWGRWAASLHLRGGPAGSVACSGMLSSSGRGLWGRRTRTAAKA